MNEQQQDFYLKLRKNINTWIESKVGKEHRWSEFLLLAPDLFHLLVKLSLDNDVPAGKKLKIAGAIAYFISPIDIMPEIFFGPIGYLDDIALAAYVLNDIINDINPSIIRRNWAGESDILDLVKTILANANKFLGKGVWEKVKKLFGRI